MSLLRYGILPKMPTSPPLSKHAHSRGDLVDTDEGPTACEISSGLFKHLTPSKSLTLIMKHPLYSLDHKLSFNLLDGKPLISAMKRPMSRTRRKVFTEAATDRELGHLRKDITNIHHRKFWVKNLASTRILKTTIMDRGWKDTLKISFTNVAAEKQPVAMMFRDEAAPGVLGLHGDLMWTGTSVARIDSHLRFNVQHC